MSAPEFWLIAGLNGSGKSTFSKRAERDLFRVKVLNPDEVTKKYLACLHAYYVRWPKGYVRDFANKLAVEKVECVVKKRISAKKTVVVETVLSSPKYFPHVIKAKKLGFRVGMIYVALSSVELNIQRVRIRVSEGGHDVPEEKIRARHARSLDNLVKMLPHLDEFIIFDNSDASPALVAEKKQRILEVRDSGRLQTVIARLQRHFPA